MVEGSGDGTDDDNGDGDDGSGDMRLVVVT